MQLQITKKKIAISIIAIIFLLLVVLKIIKVPCIFHEITGLYCPGCGITRMIISIIHFDFYQAFRYNPLIFILSPILIVISSIEIFCYLFDIENKYIKKYDKLLIILIVLLILFGILRNIPLFSYLKPTKI